VPPVLLQPYRDDRDRLQCPRHPKKGNHRISEPLSQEANQQADYQSDQVSAIYLRRQCNRFLRVTAHLWVDLSHHYRDWANLLPCAPEQGTKPGLSLALLGCPLAKKARPRMATKEAF